MRILSTMVLVLAGLGEVASANGFFLYEHDARETGRAGTGTATDGEPSAIVYNPGGIAVGEGTAFSIGGALVSPSASYTDPSNVQTSTQSTSAVLPQFFMTHRITDLIAVGIGFHMPFGLEVDWPDSSPQAEIATKQSLRTYFITPAVGVNLGRFLAGLSVGAGLDLVPATVELQQKVIFGSTEGDIHLGGHAFGIGARLGAMWRVNKSFSVGAMWRSKVKLDFSGTGDFDIADPYRGQLPPDGDVKTTIDLPQAVTEAVAYRPNRRLELELDVMEIYWSSFQQIAIDLPGGSQMVSPQNYRDRTTVRFGAEYALPELAATVRAGYIHDPTPVPNSTISARLPDIDRNILTVGASYAPSQTFGVHGSLLWVLPDGRSASDQLYMPIYKGSYDVTALVISLMLDGRFGR